MFKIDIIATGSNTDELMECHERSKEALGNRFGEVILQIPFGTRDLPTVEMARNNRINRNRMKREAIRFMTWSLITGQKVFRAFLDVEPETFPLLETSEPVPEGILAAVSNRAGWVQRAAKIAGVTLDLGVWSLSKSEGKGLVTLGQCENALVLQRCTQSVWAPINAYMRKFQGDPGILTNHQEIVMDNFHNSHAVELEKEGLLPIPVTRLGQEASVITPVPPLDLIHFFSAAAKRFTRVAVYMQTEDGNLPRFVEALEAASPIIREAVAQAEGIQPRN